MTDASQAASLAFQEQTLPPYHPSHGTPSPMVRRVLDFELPHGAARWEQTDYGHPGRLNPWEPRRIDAKLQSSTAELRAVAEAMTALLNRDSQR